MYVVYCNIFGSMCEVVISRVSSDLCSQWHGAIKNVPVVRMIADGRDVLAAAETVRQAHAQRSLTGWQHIIARSQTTLNMAGCRFGQLSRTAALWPTLLQNRNVTHVDLSANALDDAAVVALCQVVRSVRHDVRWVYLNLDDNPFGDVGLLALADVLRVNTTLTSLGIPAVTSTPLATETFAQALAINDTLVHLHHRYVQRWIPTAYAMLRLNGNIVHNGQQRPAHEKQVCAFASVCHA
jgi:hypothetical protein